MALAQTPPHASEAVPVENVAKTPAPEKGIVEDDVFVLSPFEVTGAQDKGFVAAKALTGGRMALDLKDSPAAYSVITREFIDALSIRDLNQATDWGTNTSRFMDPTGGGDLFNTPVQSSVRGVGVGQFRQLNFFPYFAPLDTYRLERIDVGRGPNAVMFGNGTIGGTQVAMSKRARFDKPFQTVEVQAGSYDRYRTSIDINQPMGEKVAGRLNAVYQDYNGWRDYTMDDNKAVTGTVTYKIGPKTQIRLEGENGRQQRHTPYLNLADRVAGWNGTTTFSGPMTDAIRTGTVAAATGGFLSANGDPQGVNRRGADYYVYNPAGSGNKVLDYQNDPMTKGGGDGTLTPIAGYTAAGMSGAGASSFNTNGAPLLFGDSADLPSGRFDALYSSPYTHFSLPSQSFTNSFKGPLIIEDYNDVELTFSHAFTDNLYFEAAGTVNHSKGTISQIESGLADVYVDINRLLPNGETNPNFGRVYGDSGVYGNNTRRNNNKVFRSSLAYIKDFEKWGNYSFNLMGGYTNQKADSGPNYRYSLAVNPDHRQWANSDVFRVRQYWGDSVASNTPPAGPLEFTDYKWGTGSTPTATTTNTVTPRWVVNNTGTSPFQFSDTDYKYAMGATNAKLFKEHLILTGAVRYDSYKQQRTESVMNALYPSDWDGTTLFLRPNAPADYYNLTYVPKNSAGVATGPAIVAQTRPTLTNANGASYADPIYANDRFQSDYNAPPLKSSKTTYAVGAMYHVFSWVSLGGNYATSYLLGSNTTPAIDGSILPPYDAKGWDTSVRFTLLRDTFYLTLNHFDNTETGGYVSSVPTNGNINSLYAANAAGDASTSGRNIRDAQDIFSAANDIHDRSSKGNEVEITANLMPGWRAVASYGRSKVETYNSYPMSIAYIAAHKDVFRQILQDAGGVLDTSVPVAPGAPGTARMPTVQPAVSPDLQSAVNAYNSIYQNSANYTTGRQLDQDAIVINIYSDYAIQTGALKNLRFGLGYQYRGKVRTGYRGSDTIVDPNNPHNAIDNPNVDAYTPVFAPGYDKWTGDLGYTWKLKKGMALEFNLRIDNLLNQKHPLWSDGTSLRPLGGDYTSPARESVSNRLGEFREPRSYTLTTTLRL